MPHEEAGDDWNECADCGVTLSPADDRVAWLGDGVGLCQRCATRRGGVYDRVGERWIRDPDVTGLPDARKAPY